MIRVLLTDDHPVVRAGLRGMLAAGPDIEVAGEAGSGPEAVALTRTGRYDVVLMDLRMPGGDGVAANREIVAADPGARVLVLTTYETDADILRAVEAGATGYLLKDAAPAELASAVRATARGETVLAPLRLRLGLMAARRRRSSVLSTLKTLWWPQPWPPKSPILPGRWMPSWTRSVREGVSFISAPERVDGWACWMPPSAHPPSVYRRTFSRELLRAGRRRWPAPLRPLRTTRPVALGI